ncbi:MAG: hypothetical protein KDJ37_11225 [Hyphomicrobiaceae bacterium]|nr:hypothetical protein [Hyphomicrobiaceae bacterium]
MRSNDISAIGWQLRYPRTSASRTNGQRPRATAFIVAALLAAGAPFSASAADAPSQSSQSNQAATADGNGLHHSYAEWPCVQHKQPVLTAAQVWDGPPVAAEGAPSNDDAIRKMVQVVITRRIPMEDVEKALKSFSESYPETKRDAKLTELFAAVLDAINKRRSVILDGIERFQERQVARSKKLEEESTALAALQKKAEADPSLTSDLLDAQQRYDWDARVFQERQQNIPVACEVPVLIEQRLFAASQAIRNLMSN